jgi:hypothetical protein
MTREDVVAMAHKANINVHTGGFAQAIMKRLECGDELVT